MKRFLLDMRIGTKLGISSGLAIALVAAMIVIQLRGNAVVRSANERAAVQQTIVKDAVDAVASIRGMQIAVRDMRLARTGDDLDKAGDTLKTRQQSATRLADEMLRLSTSRENRERIEKLKGLVGDYARHANGIGVVIREANELQAKASGVAMSAETGARVEALRTEAMRIAREVTLPIAAQIEKLEVEIVEFAKARGAEAQASAADEMLWIERENLAVGSAAALLLVLSCIMAIFTVARPMQALGKSMNALAEGDFAVVLPGLGRKDEIGAVAQSVEKFKILAQERARQEAEAKAAQEHEAAQLRKAEMRKLADGFEAAVGEIVRTVSSASTELEAAAGTLTQTASMTQQLSINVASASEEASANVQSVASATEEMSSSIGEIGRQIENSTSIARTAVEQARQTDSRINALNQAASKIGDVIDLITTIAEQTNLLALNATIEAARAGESGRGFAVVASEVKTLAAQTAKATGEISGQIAEIQAATGDSVAAIKQIGETIGSISQVTSTIAAAVEEQSAATQEIARNVQQAAEGTGQVAGSISEVNRGAAETGSASSQVLASAQSLSSESERLRLEVDRFLATIRAA
jgi:methyl-accepting chemotaxis protein